MSKLKVKYKDNQIIVNSKLDKTEEVNQQELQIMHSKIIRGLMKPTLSKQNKITYSSPKGLTLKNYLSNSISVNDFFLLFAQVLEIIKSVERNSFNINNLVMNMDYSYVNEQTKELHMIYQPILTQVISTNVTSFLYDIAYNVNLVLSEDYNEINCFINFLKSLQTFSAECIEQYILKSHPHIYSQFFVNKDEPYENSNMPETVSFINENELDEMPETVAFIDSPEPDEMPETLAFVDTPEPNEMPETVAFSNALILSACIFRVRTGEKIIINKPNFIIGKSFNDTDYCVTNNNTISRLHASIICENNSEFYLVDLGSANHSYVEGVLVVPNEKYKLFKGSRFYLSNEEFIFSLD